MKRRYIYESASFTVEDILAIIANVDSDVAEDISKRYSKVLQYYVDNNWDSAEAAAENIYTVYNYGFDPDLCLKIAKNINKMFNEDSINENINDKKSKKRYSEEEYDEMQDFLDDCIEVIE